MFFEIKEFVHDSPQASYSAIGTYVSRLVVPGRIFKSEAKIHIGSLATVAKVNNLQMTTLMHCYLQEMSWPDMLNITASTRRA